MDLRSFIMKISLTGTVMFLIFSLAATAMAVDISALDRVSVLMPKEKVLSIMGPPDETGTVSMGLKADIYKVSGAPKSDTGLMLGAGLVYDTNGILKGQALMFDGKVARQSAEHMKTIGFALVEEKGNSFQLLGKDDDSGLLIVVSIFEREGITTIMTFEKEFHDRMAK
jgi:hypothetical protein